MLKLAFIGLAFGLLLSMECTVKSIPELDLPAEVEIAESFENIGEVEQAADGRTRIPFQYLRDSLYLYPSMMPWAQNDIYLSDVSADGDKSLLFVTSPYFEEVEHRKRTEVVQTDEGGGSFGPGDTKCFATTVMIDDPKFAADRSNFTFWQIHGSGANDWSRVAITAVPHENKVVVNMSRTIDNTAPLIEKDLAPIVPGQWERWVVFYKISTADDGVVRIYRNGHLAFEHYGYNADPKDGNRLFFKFGRYNWPFADADYFIEQGIKETYTYHDDLYVIRGEGCLLELHRRAPQYFPH